MTQTISSQRASRKKHKNYRGVPFNLIRDARNGDVDAMTLIQRHYDPYIRRLATMNFDLRKKP